MKWQSVALSAIVAVLASGAIALAGPIGPSVQSQTNPIRSFSVDSGNSTSGNKEVYSVPKGSVFIITDILIGTPMNNVAGKNASQPTLRGTVLVDGQPRLHVHNVGEMEPTTSNFWVKGLRDVHRQLKTGLLIKAGSKIALQCASNGSSKNIVITITGYLARP